MGGERGNERSGLLLIGAALLVILAVTGLLVRQEHEARRERTRVQGVSLARLLASIPQERLVARGGQGPLQVMQLSQGNPDFAYGLVVDRRGEPLVAVTSEGVAPPRAVPSPDPTDWLGERELADPTSGRRLREFYAPVLENGELVGQVRIGFTEPGWGVPFAQVPVLAGMALFIFLLAPLAWYLLRRELQPLSRANEQILELVEGRELAPVRIEATGELGEFASRFNALMQVAGERIRSLEAQQVGLLASSKVLSYRTGRTAALLESLPDGAFVMNDEGVVEFANAKVEPLLDVPAEEMRGKRLGEWCRDTDVAAFLARYASGSGRAPRSDALDLARGEGSAARHLRVSAHPLPAPGGGERSAGTLVLVRDTTAAVLASRSQAEFVTHVAHELKSPLNVLAMYSEMLAGKDGEREEFRIEACNVIQDEVERLSLLISTMLSIARLETGVVTLERQRVRPGDFLKDVLDTVSRGGQRDGLRFSLQVPRELPPLQLDKELMRVALNNLLTNAIKYNRPGGEVALVAEDLGDRIAIRVRDTGLGIPAEEHERIFEKFYRSANEEAHARGGHGLGLALVRQIVERHGGEILVESEPGEGSEFTILLRKAAVVAAESA